MKTRFRLYRRHRGGRYYIHDETTGKQESLHTSDRPAALRLLHAKNEAVLQPAMNLQIAQVYLQHGDPAMSRRTWQHVMEQIISTKQGPTRERWDYAIRIHEKEADSVSEHSFFLELDRSSETQDTLIARAGCYLDYQKSGGFAVRSGGSRGQFKDFPFRVLMVFKTAERRNNTAERLLQSNPPIFTQVMLSTFEEVIANPLGPIWIYPRDYRAAVKGSPFDTEQHREQWGYKRQTERELLVERKVKKFRLLVG